MEIYIADGTQQTGPFDVDRVKAGLATGEFAPDQLAWHEGAAGWEPLDTLPEFQPAAAPPEPAPPEPAPAALAESVEPAAPADPIAPPQGSGIPGGRAGRSRAAWTTIGLVVLGLLALFGVLWRIGHVFQHPGNSQASASPSPSVSPSQSPGAAASPAGEGSGSAGSAGANAGAGGTRHFVADRSKYGGDLAMHYVGFSFDYPDTWKLADDRQENYVEVDLPVVQPNGKTAVGASATFSYAYNKPGFPLAQYLYASGPQLLGMLSEPLAKQYADCTTTPARMASFGRYTAEEQLITAHIGPQRTGVYLRLLIVAQLNDSTDGLSVSFAGGDQAGCRSAEELGDSGGLQTIRDSFRFEQ